MCVWHKKNRKLPGGNCQLPIMPPMRPLLLLLLPLFAFAQRPPNIIWLMAEDISTDLGCYGFPEVRTPELDRLAAAGQRYTNAFVTNPICSPSRSAMLLGVHQRRSNTHHHRSNRDVPLAAPFRPLTQLLREAGYRTVLGHHGVLHRGRKIDVNFRHEALGPWDGHSQFGLFDRLDSLPTDGRPFFAQIQLAVTHRGDWWEDISRGAPDRHDPARVTLPPYLADHPAVRADWARYLDQLEFMDREVGMIRRELDSLGLADRTVLIFIGDNGRANLRGKGYLHDSGLRIPLIVYDPTGRWAGPPVDERVVSATDLTATILQLAGAELPDYLTGIPLYESPLRRQYVYATRDLWDEIAERSSAVTSGRWKYIRNDRPAIPWDAGQAYPEFYRPALHAMRPRHAAGRLSPAEAIFFAPNKPAEELYDLTNDPHELTNLATAPAHAARLAELRALTARLDRRYAPRDSSYHPVHPTSVDVLDYVRRHHPEASARMQAGEEIGFGKYLRMWEDFSRRD